MKKLKRIFALVLAAAMVLAMNLTAFAEETTYTITAPNNTHTYEVYQIFTGDYHNGVLSNIKWGQNGTGDEGEAVDSSIIDELKKASGSDTEKLKVIEQYVNLKSNALDTVSNGSMLEVPGGYYLIKDVDNALDGKNDAYTLYIVQVADDVTITPKAKVPEFEKKVQDINDTNDTAVSGDGWHERASAWQDSADWDIGDKVPFQLKGTVADNYADYTKYKFIFHDHQSAGLTFDSSSVKVYVDGTEIKRGYNVVTTGLEDDGCTFEVVFDDLKGITSVHAGSVITVEYQSELNEKAVIGSAGNPNTADLEFSNNPNDKQGGETGTTPDDTVIVFTYKTVIDKVDGQNQSLAGAAFKLEKKLQDGSWTVVKEYTVDEETGLPSAPEITKFEFTGLDDGTYKLTETATPAGYNTIDPIEFSITAEHEIKSDKPTLTSLNGTKVSGEISFTAKKDEGALTANVVNKSGLELPETGGIGTTVFYILGGILVIGASVVLIVRRRMNTDK